MKIVTIVGTRPELIKLSRVIAELDDCTDHVLVHTEQNYDWELNGIFFEQLGIKKPDYFLGVAGSHLGESVGNVIAKSYEVLLKEKPDAVLILGDTNSALSVISAKRLKIPIFHMEAGNRSFDERVPEEVNRRIVDHTSDINLPYTEYARRHLLAEGISSNYIIKTGSPMKEVIDFYFDSISSSDILSRLGIEKTSYFVASVHREENVDSKDRLSSLFDAFSRLCSDYDMPLLISVHPRTQKRLEEFGIQFDENRIRLMKAMGFFDYVNLQKNAACVLSDSGTITEESAILKFPAVTVRESHERQEGMDRGSVVMCGLKSNRILESVCLVMKNSIGGYVTENVEDYEVVDVSKKVVRIIFSYVDYVNKFIWMKEGF